MQPQKLYLECPPIKPDRVARVYESIEAWVNSSAFSELVEDFGSKLPVGLAIEALIAWSLEFSDRWDFRRLQQEAGAKDLREGARWLLNDSNFTSSQIDLIERCSVVLGLIGAKEPRGQCYDYTLVLGGARLSCLLRPRLAAELITERRIRSKAVVLLASARPVSESERDATDTYAPMAVNEFDLINEGAEKAFHLTGGHTEERCDDPDNVNKSWIIRAYDSPDGLPPIASVCAPSSEPDRRRANSADTYEFFLSRFGVPPGASCLLVTSQIYVPYQQLEAIRTLAIPHDVIVETVGFPPAWGGELQGMTGPTNYLQEIRSTIQSADRFLKSFPRTAVSPTNHAG